MSKRSQLSIPFAIIFGNAPWDFFNYWFEILFFTIYAVIGYALLELQTGFRGMLPFAKNIMITYRNTFRGFLIAQYVLIQVVASFVGIFQRHEIVLTFPAFILILLYISNEIIILSRDHINGLYPLEPDFRPFIRLFTPHYLLVEIPFLLTLGYIASPFNQDLFNSLVAILPAIAAIITYVKKYPVSARYWITLISLQLAAMFFSQLAQLLIFILPVMYIGRHFPRKLRLNFGWLQPVKTKYKEYYEQK